MKIFKDLCERIKKMFYFPEEKQTFESKQVFCLKMQRFINEGDCLSSILDVTDKKELEICREKCEYGMELRKSCPFDKRWRDLQIDSIEKLGGNGDKKDVTLMDKPLWIPEEHLTPTISEPEPTPESVSTEPVEDIPMIPEPKTDVRTLGQRLKAAREALGMTQKQVAAHKKSNFSIRSYCRWETDKVKISPEKISSLAAILRLPKDFFE